METVHRPSPMRPTAASNSSNTMMVSESDRQDPVEAFELERHLFLADDDDIDDDAPLPAAAVVPLQQPPYHATAVTLVQSLQEQLALKDAPPCNNTSSNVPAMKTSTTGSLYSNTHNSKPQDNDAYYCTTSRQSSPTELLAGASSFDTDLSGSLTSAHVAAGLLYFHNGGDDNELHKSTQQQRDYHSTDHTTDATNMAAVADTMGHSALQALCQWTLEQVGQETEQDDEYYDDNDDAANAAMVPLQIETDRVLQQVHDTSNDNATTPSVMSVASSSFQQQQRQHSKNKSPTRLSKLKFWNKNAKSQQRGQQQQVTRTTPLQMFGSDYARYLHKTALAPATAAACRRRNRSKRRNNKNNASTAHHHHHHQYDCISHLQDADAAITTGAVLDIQVVSSTAATSASTAGYYIAATFGNKLHLIVKKEPVWDKAAQRPTVTAVTVIFPDRHEFVPPGFCIVKTAGSQQPANLAAATSSSERVYLCFRRSREGNPVVDITALRPDEGDVIPVGFTVVEKSPRNHSAAIMDNTNNNGRLLPVFLAYRQRLCNLETIRPLALVMSVQQLNSTTAAATATAPVFEDVDESTEQHDKLQAYYATGGTTVSSDVGRFHIMDRSTHSLLSPSSVSNRLKLIAKSRRKAEEACGDNNNNGSSSSRETGDNDSMNADSIEESIESFRKHGGGGGSIAGSIDSVGDSIDVSSVMLSALLGSRHADNSSLQSMFGCEQHDPAVQQCLAAMRFIPGVDTATRGMQKINATRRLQTRAALAVPILTACYTRHGGCALVAVDGLTELLEQDFFADDVDLSDESDNESSTRLTLLDLAIQAVCDVATTSAQEITFGSCVEFVEKAVEFSHGQLNTRTIGFVVRFYLFVFSFGVSIPTTSSSWPSPLWRGSSLKQEGIDHDVDEMPMLFDPRTETSRGYLPGGAPQAAALALKELVSLSIVRLGKVSVNDLVVLAHTGANTSTPFDEDSTGGLVDSLLASLVDDAVDHVEIADYTQLALHQVQRSGGSELFWHDMIHSCGSKLFRGDSKIGEAGRDIFTMVFAVMANLVKASSGKMRSSAKTGAVLPRDIASKLLSMELLLHFLEYWSDEQEAVSGIESVKTSGPVRSIYTLGFTIRRMVVPCLLANTRAALEDPRVFQRVIRIVSELWCSPVYRRHCKAELGVLFEHFALRLLQLGPQLIASRKVDLSSDKATISLLSQQADLIKEIKNWFSFDPKDVIEMYLNYDTDISSQMNSPIQLIPGTQLKLFQRLCSGLSNIAEQCGELIGDQIRENQSKVMSRSQEEGGGLSDLVAAMEDNKGGRVDKTAMRESARILRKTSLEAISQIVKALAISAAAATGNEFTSLLLSWTPPESPIAYQRTQLAAPMSYPDSFSSLDVSGNKSAPSDGDDDVLLYWRNAISQENKQRLSDSSPSSEDALKTALDIAKRKSLKKAIEYLIACNALMPAPRDIANFLRIHKEELDPTGLGYYLGESGIGGAETEYWNSIRHSYVRAICFTGMNVEQGLRHFLTNCGFRLPGEAQKIDRIMNTFAQCYFEDNAGDTQRCPFKEEDTVYLLSFAIIMLNTDLHKSSIGSRNPKKTMTKPEFTNNLRGVAQGEDINRDYLSIVFDSVEANPIAMHESDFAGGSASEDRHRTLQDMLNNVRTGDSLLRGLAVHDFKFANIDDFGTSLDYTGNDALSDLTRSCVSKTWHQWHGVVNTGLETAHLDPQGMEPSVEILLYALSITICLDMPTERAAFMSQLGRLKAFEELRQGRWVTAPDHESFHNEDWYLKLEQACAGARDRKLWALREIRAWMDSLQSALQVDVQNKVEMTRAVSKLKDGDFLLHDPGRSFVRDSALIKKSGRTGRSTPYRFFLFSDVLLYANKDVDGRYKMHEELPLHLMKIVDWFPPTQKNRHLTFEVHHPTKKFQVICDSPEERKSWVEDIREAIKREMVRKMKVEQARLAAHHG